MGDEQTDVVVLRDVERNGVRHIYRVAGRHSESGCFEWVVIWSEDGREREQVMERLTLEELEREFRRRRVPLLLRMYYRRAIELIRAGPWRSDRSQYPEFTVLSRRRLETGKSCQFLLRLEEGQEPVFEWAVLHPGAEGGEWEQWRRRWTPQEMWVLLQKGVPRGSFIDPEAALEALERLRAAGLWMPRRLRTEARDKVSFCTAPGFAAALWVLSWRWGKPGRQQILPDPPARDLLLGRIALGRARVLPSPLREMPRSRRSAAEGPGEDSVLGRIGRGQSRLLECQQGGRPRPRRILPEGPARSSVLGRIARGRTKLLRSR